MQFLRNLCLLCLSNDPKLMSQHNLSPSILEIAGYIFPECMFSNSETPSLCDNCLNSLKNICYFRQKCLESIETYKKYVQKLKHGDGSLKYLSIEITDIQNNQNCERSNGIQKFGKIKAETNFDEKIKSEIPEMDYYNAETENNRKMLGKFEMVEIHVKTEINEECEENENLNNSKIHNMKNGGRDDEHIPSDDLSDIDMGAETMLEQIIGKQELAGFHVKEEINEEIIIKEDLFEEDLLENGIPSNSEIHNMNNEKKEDEYIRLNASVEIGVMKSVESEKKDCNTTIPFESKLPAGFTLLCKPKIKENWFCNRPLSPVNKMKECKDSNEYVAGNGDLIEMIDYSCANSSAKDLGAVVPKPQDAKSIFKPKIKENWFCNRPLSPVNKMKGYNDSNEYVAVNDDFIAIKDYSRSNSSAKDLGGFVTISQNARNIRTQFSSHDSSADSDSISETSIEDESHISANVDSPVQTIYNEGSEKEVEDQDGGSQKIFLIPSTSNVEQCPKKNTKRIRKKDLCIFCKTLVSCFARHIGRNHPNEIEVQRILSLPMKSKERQNLSAVLRKKGNYLLNSRKCKKPMRKSGNTNPVNFLPCVHCLGFYNAKYLRTHVKHCSENRSSSIEVNNVQAVSQNYLVRHLKIDQQLRSQVFTRMRADDISLVAKKDILICAFGARYLKTHNAQNSIHIVSRKIRELSRLLIEIIKMEPTIKNLFQALQPKFFDLFVKAVQVLCKYDSEKDLFKSPSLAVSIATSLKQCCDIQFVYTLKKNNGCKSKHIVNTRTNIQNIKKIFESNWKFEIGQTTSNLNIQE